MGHCTALCFAQLFYVQNIRQRLSYMNLTEEEEEEEEEKEEQLKLCTSVP